MAESQATPCSAGAEPVPNNGWNTLGDVGAVTVSNPTPKGNLGSVEVSGNVSTETPLFRKKPKNRGLRRRRGKLLHGSEPEPESSGEMPGVADASPSVPRENLQVMIQTSNYPGERRITSGRVRCLARR